MRILENMTSGIRLYWSLEPECEMLMSTWPSGPLFLGDQGHCVGSSLRMKDPQTRTPSCIHQYRAIRLGNPALEPYQGQTEGPLRSGRYAKVLGMRS